MSDGMEIVPEGIAGEQKKIIVVGIGGNGCKMIQSFTAQPGASQYVTAAVDTDKESLASSGAQSSVQAESDWTIKSGLGCGGDVMKGERAIARERTKLVQLLTGYDFILVCGGLGGGTATGGLRILASVIRSLSTPSLFLLTTPFAFESYTKRKNAENCINELLPVTEALITLPNDLLFSTLPPDSPAEDAFRKASIEMAGSVFGAAEILRSRKLIGSDFAEISSLLQKRRASCAIGIGRASADDGLDRCGIALEHMLESPFLGGAARLESSNAVILTITGGPDMKLDEMKRAIENASSILPNGTNLSVGATICPDYDSMIQISALAVRYDQLPEATLSSAAPSGELWDKPAPPVSRGIQKEANGLEQIVFDLQSFSKGIFVNSQPVKYRDEDLDVPTFQRRGITIDKGSTGK